MFSYLFSFICQSLHSATWILRDGCQATSRLFWVQHLSLRSGLALQTACSRQDLVFLLSVWNLHGTTPVAERVEKTPNINRPELLGSTTPGRETGQNPSVPVCPTIALKAGEGKDDMAGKAWRFKLRMMSMMPPKKGVTFEKKGQFAIACSFSEGA